MKHLNGVVFLNPYSQEKKNKLCAGSEKGRRDDEMMDLFLHGKLLKAVCES